MASGEACAMGASPAPLFQKSGFESSGDGTSMKALVLVLFLGILQPLAVGAAEVAPPSPAEQRIAADRQVLQKQPNRSQAYNDLALALIRRARETGNSAYLEQADEAVRNSLRIQPANFEGAQAHVALLLAKQRYRAALDEARALNQHAPDSVTVWGDMAEAQAALGDYQDAEKSVQWMMNLRPGNLPAYLAGASLRESWGDTDGALEFLNQALQQTPPFEPEATAWILTRMARIRRQAGQFDPADALLSQALTAFPDYYASLEELAEVRLAEHRNGDAVELMERRNQTFPTPSSYLLEARALDRAGRPDDAARMYSTFERAARAQIDLPDNANVELINDLAVRTGHSQEALRIARIQVESRHDVRSLDAYAWALYANGQYAEAGRQIEKALAVGARDATLFYHAGEIQAAFGKRAEARRDWQQSLDVNPASDVAEAARRGITQTDNLAATR